MGDLPLPPLHVDIVELMRDLFPKATWTKSLRIQWRERLARKKVKVVLLASRDHHAESKAYQPCLADVLRNTRLLDPHKGEWNKCGNEYPSDADLESDALNVNQEILKMDKDARTRAAAELQKFLSCPINPNPDTWTPTRRALICAIARTQSLSPSSKTGC